MHQPTIALLFGRIIHGRKSEHHNSFAAIKHRNLIKLKWYLLPLFLFEDTQPNKTGHSLRFTARFVTLSFSRTRQKVAETTNKNGHDWFIISSYSIQFKNQIKSNQIKSSHQFLIPRNGRHQQRCNNAFQFWVAAGRISGNGCIAPTIQ